MPRTRFCALNISINGLWLNLNCTNYLDNKIANIMCIISLKYNCHESSPFFQDIGCDKMFNVGGKTKLKDEFGDFWKYNAFLTLLI